MFVEVFFLSCLLLNHADIWTSFLILMKEIIYLFYYVHVNLIRPFFIFIIVIMIIIIVSWSSFESTIFAFKEITIYVYLDALFDHILHLITFSSFSLSCPCAPTIRLCSSWTSYFFLSSVISLHYYVMIPLYISYQLLDPNTIHSFFLVLKRNNALSRNHEMEWGTTWECGVWFCSSIIME